MKSERKQVVTRVVSNGCSNITAAKTMGLTFHNNTYIATCNDALFAKKCIFYNNFVFFSMIAPAPEKKNSK